MIFTLTDFRFSSFCKTT